jgi:uncharacterized membrane protein YkgB
VGRFGKRFERYDASITHWMEVHGVTMLRRSLGVVFFWFGVLKFFPGSSPAEDLAARTISELSLGMVPSSLSVPALAAWECIVGLGLIGGWFMRATLALLWAQMLGTVTPLFLFPAETFTRIPFQPTMEGQYIIKNIVLVTAAFVVGATVRGGGLVAEPEALSLARKREEETALGEEETRLALEKARRETDETMT